MPVYQVTMTDDAAPSVLTIEDKRSLKNLSEALVDDDFIVTDRVSVIWGSVEFEGETLSSSSVTFEERISLFAPYVSRIAVMDLPGEK